MTAVSDTEDQPHEVEEIDAAIQQEHAVMTVANNKLKKLIQSRAY